LTRLLYERATAFDFDRSRGVVVLPCELIDNNGKLLGEIVHTLAERWELGAKFTRWLGEAVEFRNTLVDRIVTGAPSPEEALCLAEELGYDDAMTTVCEPYRLLAIEGDDALRCRLGFADGTDGIVVTPDIGAYRERKVRILNGGHTATVSVALLAGLDTVRAAVADERVGRFMRHAIFEEIVPGLTVPGAEAFAATVVDRFGNPFVDHMLVDITLQGTAKMRARVVPSVVAYHRRFGRVPSGLALGFAAYLLTMRGEGREARRAAGQRVPFDSHAETLAAHWRNAGALSLGALVSTVVADVLLWGGALRDVDGFGALVTEHLVRLDKQGIHAALDAHLAAAQAAP
jgi:tagaturonate reductase